MEKKEIAIIGVAYKQYKEIHIFINCFLCQTIDNWKLYIIHDGPDEKMKEIVENYSKIYENIKYLQTDIRYNDWGHSLREIGINIVEEEFILLTNVDNYYVPKFLEIMFRNIKKDNLDFLVCNMIHSYKFWDRDEYSFFDSLPILDHIDMGNFIVKTLIAKTIGFKWCKCYKDADGRFVDEIMNRYKETIKIGKINNVLFVHN